MATEYYNVLIWLDGKTGEPSLSLLDRSLKDVRKQFVKPYKNAAKVFSKGVVYDLSKLTKVLILRTDANSLDLVKLENEKQREATRRRNLNSRGPMFLSRDTATPWESVLKNGTDVTSDFIDGPPGQTSLLSKALNHPWTLAIGTIAAGALLAYFNLA